MQLQETRMPKIGTTVGEFFPEELEQYIRTHKEGTYLLLDIRQPEEYEEGHLPGSKLIPLPVLADSLAELDQDKDTIVYCGVGGRSQIAARFLAARGFPRIYQLRGGIEAWEQQPAIGPVEFHLEFIRGDETPEEAALMAYRMENGLELFHRAAIQSTDNPEVKSLLENLAKAEEGHKSRLLKLLQDLGNPVQPDDPSSMRQKGGIATGKNSAEGAPEAHGADLMEGGLSIDKFLRENLEYLKTVSGCLEVAMMIEVQAFDLYLRMAEVCADPGAKKVFFALSDEEKAHLGAIGDLLGKQVDSRR